MNSSNSEVPRRGILWFATIAMALFTGFMCLFFSQAGWTRFSVGFEVISGAVAIALLLTLINKDRYWWAMRVITFIIFALYFWYVIDECYIKQKPLQLGGLGDASP